jgi:hypothetical protein
VVFGAQERQNGVGVMRGRQRRTWTWTGGRDGDGRRGGPLGGISVKAEEELGREMGLARCVRGGGRGAARRRAKEGEGGPASSAWCLR